MTPVSAWRIWSRGPFAVLRTHHRDQQPQHVLMLMVVAGALALLATILVAGAAGYSEVASHLRYVHAYWFAFAIVGAVAAHVGYTVAYREVAHVGRGVRLGTLRAAAIVAAGFGMFFPRGGFAVDLEALEDLGVPRDEARVRVLGLGSLEYAVLSAGACACAILLLVDHYPAQRAAALDAISVVGMIVASPRRHGAAAVTGMAVYWAGEVFVLWVCLAAFTHHTPSVAAVVVGYATGYALTRRTLPLAGAGAVEALLPFALVWVGFGLAPAVLAVFCYRVFNLWLPLGPAIGALHALQTRPPEAPLQPSTVGRPLVSIAEVRGDDRHASSPEDARGMHDANS
jgi:uncharacterized membrane protein YbhN (UPF0104 family)